jgi:hypothetical protein
LADEEFVNILDTLKAKHGANDQQQQTVELVKKDTQPAPPLKKEKSKVSKSMMRVSNLYSD